MPSRAFLVFLEAVQSLGYEQENHLLQVYCSSLDAMGGNRLESKLISSGHSPNIYFGLVISVPRRVPRTARKVKISFSFFQQEPFQCSTLAQSVALVRICVYSIKVGKAVEHYRKKMGLVMLAKWEWGSQ